jgi:hypothetical protein
MFTVSLTLSGDTLRAVDTLRCAARRCRDR